MASTESKIEVYYWGPKMKNFYGRAIGIYLTLDEAKAKYEMTPASEMPAGVAFAPPCVSIDGNFVGQTPAILTILGEKFGLAGKTFPEKMAVLQMVEDMNDIFGEHGKFVEDQARKDKWFSYLDKKLEGKSWAAGTSSPSIADFHGVFAFEWVCQKKVDFSKYANVTKWWDNIRAHPTVAAMYASCVDGRAMIPS